MDAEPFRDSRDHVAAEMDRLLALLRASCWEKLARDAGVPVLAGLQVSPAEVRQLLSQPLNPLAPKSAADVARAGEQEAAILRAAWQAEGAQIAARRAAGGDLVFDRLAAGMGLQPFDEYVLLLALAPVVAPEIGRLYAFLQGDAALTAPTVGLALSLLELDVAAMVAARTRFEAQAPLAFYRLIARGEGHPLHRQPLYLAERLVVYLLGRPGLDDALAPFCVLKSGAAPAPDHPLAALARAQEGPLFVYLQGTYGTGRLALASSIAAALDRPLLRVDGRALREQATRLPELLALVRREARLQGAALYFSHGGQLLLEEEPYAVLTAELMKSAVAGSELIFLAGEAAWQPRAYLNRYDAVTWRCAAPDLPERRRLWQEISAGTPLASDVDLEEITGRFRFTAGQVRDAWRVARNIARLRNPAQPTVRRADLYAGAHGQAIHHLHEMAQLVAPVHTWEDIILPDETIGQLQEISRRARNIHKVYTEWGFGRKLSTNRGIVALFSGPSGTGKTMAASIIARDLGLELYRVDLSAVVSKYVGETEKNLSRIFDEAWRSNAIIFFDEADALFGKRSEVRDSHDRYANIEVNYLLQRIDAYDGIAILATNLGQNIDDAFQRRLQFTVVFPEADVASRYRIWTTIWPADVPLAPDLDFQFLAQRFKFNGGNIRNVVLQSAFLAANNGDQVTMRHLVQAVMSEVRKSGKLISEHDFGPYAYLLLEE